MKKKLWIGLIIIEAIFLILIEIGTSQSYYLFTGIVCTSASLVNFLFVLYMFLTRKEKKDTLLYLALFCPLFADIFFGVTRRALLQFNGEQLHIDIMNYMGTSFFILMQLILMFYIERKKLLHVLKGGVVMVGIGVALLISLKKPLHYLYVVYLIIFLFNLGELLYYYLKEKEGNTLLFFFALLSIFISDIFIGLSTLLKQDVLVMISLEMIWPLYLFGLCLFDRLLLSKQKEL